MRLYYLVLVLLAGIACNKEAALTPEPIPPVYTLPQGNHDYDDTIVAWYKKYNTFILYKFTQLDYAYNYYDKKPDSAFNANPAYVASTLRFIREELLEVYPEAFLKTTLPYKILLASYIGSGTTRSATGFSASSNMLAIGWADSTLAQKTPAQRKQLRGWLHRAYMERTFRTDNTIIPDAFKALAPPAYGQVLPAKLLEEGIVEPYTNALNVATDFLAYIEVITSHTKEELEAGVLSSRVDVKGLIRKKYDVVIATFLNKYQIDLQAIGNRP
ncbi:hypothetical protein SAMN05660461_5222 [Chitinophaga ginsengisegetis]|uniref:Uncharacterized protein n=1 Tax=Chitinophaga ginsengisegetis TaxID=393003 RepID=A0A1T5P9P2_9BACT|nr:hypothetical protein [Chitinophaga ginsengisegetis]SKD09337.1 hypothetical protein SAMN05660461_5222 [Chitinophaga ginsengisegetis]